MLTKSDYMLFLRHPAWMWLKAHEKWSLPPIDANTQAVFDAGHEFEDWAEKLFFGGIKLGFKSYNEYLALPKKTEAALKSGAKTIFQGRFEAEGLTAIVDVLDRADQESFNLIEIKSSTKTKPEHEYDLAFQALVLKKAGIKIKQIKVIHVNKEYVREGEIEPKALTVTTEVTEAVELLKEETETQVMAALKMMMQREKPDLSPRYANPLGISGTSWFEDWLAVYKHLKPNLPSDSIYFLSYPSAAQIGTLEDQGIKTIGATPEKLALRPKQAMQIQTTKTGQRIILKKEIKEFVESLSYPLYFLDYETLSTIVPVFDGFSPYKDYPFQYSLHFLESPDAKLKHCEYLHTDNSNPVPPLVKHLKEDLGKKGTILAWNMSYEKGCNERMAQIVPEEKKFLEDVNQRVNDLMLPFSNMWLVDKDFRGSASVKKVLPVIVPSLNYQDLAIGDGLLARRLWTDTVLKGKNPEKKAQILADLLAYCTLDTYAMVEILGELRKLVG